MIHKLALLAAPMALVAGPVAAAGEAAEEYLYQTPRDETFAAPLDVAADLVGDYPETTEAGPTMQLTLEPLADNPQQLVLVVRIDPVLDDSVAAEEWRAVLSQGEDFRWTVEQLGLRRKCSRGPDNGQWGPHICP